MIIPFIFTNKGSTSNNRWRVQIQDDLGEQSWIGVLAQEVFESRYKWRHLWGSLFGGDEFREEMEIKGHVAELLVAVLLDKQEYVQYFQLMLNLLDHPHGYRARYGYFASMTRDDIAQRMREVEMEVSDWLYDHMDFFKKWKAKRG